MRVLLVKPDWNLAAGHIRYGKGIRFPALGLAILAGVSGDHDVRIVDETWEAIPYDEPFELVGITTTTFSSDAAYAIADRFRARGVPVVLGGVHASILPDECLGHADAVVVGEGEYTWPRVLADAVAGRLGGVYRAPRVTDMRDVPHPRRELLQESDWFTGVEASRGCPNRCKYCYLPHVPWAEHRTRPVEVVAREVAGLRQKTFMFTDENLFADRDYALRLFRAIAPHGKSWLLQAPTTIADDDELMDAMAQAGCFDVQVGFQSFNVRALDAVAVNHNRVAKYRTLVEKMHARKILVTGFFVLGLDTDDVSVFDTTVDMIKEMDLDDACLFINTPFPGTAYWDQYEREGRLIAGLNRSHYAFSHATFEPKRMTRKQLEEGVQRAYDRLYPFFVYKMLKVATTHWDMLLSNPQLAARVFAGNLRPPRLTGRAGSLLERTGLGAVGARLADSSLGRWFGAGGGTAG